MGMKMKLLPAILMIIMLTSCAPTSTPTQTPPTSVPVLEVQMQWDSPDAAYSAIPAGEEPRYFYEKPLDTFVPSEEYGRVYLYAGDQRVTDFYSVPRLFSVFGLCTADGQIITAPIYTADIYNTCFGRGEEQLYVLYEGTREVHFEGFEEAHMGIERVWLIDQRGRWAEVVDEVLLDDPDRDYTFDFLTVRKGDKWGGISYGGEIVIPFAYDSVREFWSAAAPSKVIDGAERMWAAPQVWTSYERYNNYEQGDSVMYYFPQKTVEIASIRRPERVGNYLIFSESFHQGDSFWHEENIYDFQGNQILPEVVGQLCYHSDDVFWFWIEAEKVYRNYDREGRVLGEWTGDRYAEHMYLPNAIFTRYEEVLVVMDEKFEEIGRFEQAGGWKDGYYDLDTPKPMLEIIGGTIHISDPQTNLLRTYRSDGTLLTTCLFGGE